MLQMRTNGEPYVFRDASMWRTERSRAIPFRVASQEKARLPTACAGLGTRSGPVPLTMKCTENVMPRQPRICIDRILPAQLMRHQTTVRRAGATRALIPIGKTWMNGTTLRVRFIGGSSADRAKARQQAMWWTQFANLHFEFGEAPDAEIRVTFDEDDGAWSYVGTDNRAIPLDQPTMNLGFLDGGTAAHEFGHAIGLAHEHQNPQGGMVETRLR